MIDPVISTKGLSKGYRYYSKPMHRLKELLLRRPMHDIQWALKDINLDIYAGESIGIIGENGAGKSTLLKIIAGTTGPTSGTLSVNGKIAALLELGAGFHPEESGRDNVYMTGALNGVKPQDMEIYYHSVAEFSELSEEVINRPVKTYSSGMFMRLAFSAATAVDPDILIVDEALSVGDMYFQKKSLDRIIELKDSGKTVLFCSHNTYQLRTLCAKVAWINNGILMKYGDSEDVVSAYESYEREKSPAETVQEVIVNNSQAEFRSNVSPVKIQSVKMQSKGEFTDNFVTFDGVSISVDVGSVTKNTKFHLAIIITRNDHERVFGTSTQFNDEVDALEIDGDRTYKLNFPEFPLLSGDYWLCVYLLDDTGLQIYDMAEQIHHFTIRNNGREVGYVYIPHEWQL